MLSFLTKLFDVHGFVPRWHCGDWSAGHGWLHICSDIAVWSAYFTIPCILLYFAARKRDLPFRKVFWLFGAFILACGLTHLMEAVIFWWPAYRLAGLIKLITALVSWGTVVALLPIIPHALAMRSPASLEREVSQRTAELNQANEALRREIMERRHAENMLRDQREWLRVTLSSIGDAVIATDARGRITFMNPAAEALTDWRAAHAETRPLESVFRIAPDDDAEGPYDRALGGRSGIGLANRSTLLARSGRKVLIEDEASPIRDENGVVRGAVVVFHDVAEVRRAEQRVQFLAQAGEALMSHVESDASMQQIARLAVPAVADWCAIQLRGDGGAPDQDVRTHFDPEAEGRLRQAPRRGPLNGNGESKTSTMLLTNDPESIARNLPVELHGAAAERLQPHSLIRAPLEIRGEQVGAITFALAENERRYTADDVALVAELARRSAVALENVRLYRELRAADRRKNEFLAMLAHELRNPLAPVRNALHLLEATETNEETRRELQQVMVNQVEHIVRLVDDLLDVSRIMRGKAELRIELLPVREVIERAKQTMQPAFDDKQQELRIELPEPDVAVRGDVVRLSQVVSNLLHNACKYSPPGSTVWLTVDVEPKGVAIRVRDQGMGIEADVLPTIFDLFTQSERSIERASGGLGIGLTVVRSIVEMHNGTVEAHSNGLDQGSEFIVRLPSERNTIETKPKSWKPTPVTPLRVMVVEDNVGSAKTLALMLKKFWSHEVAVAYDGLTGLELAESFQPDLILMDIGLPGLNGYEVARSLRAGTQFASVAMVALTGYGQPDDRRKTREAGFDEHLVKPVSAEMLESVFKLVATRRSQLDRK